MKMTEKTKKYLAVGSGAIICVALVATIALQFGKASSGEDKMVEKSSKTTEIVVDPSKSSEKEETETSSVTVPPEKESGQSTETKPLVDNRPAQTDQSEQSIQPEVTKPETPSEEVLHDPTAKPDGTKVDTPPEPVQHEAVEQPKELPSEPSEPQGGDTKDGQVYLPGFGWVTDTGGSGSTADDMYENGNKIGIMD